MLFVKIENLDNIDKDRVHEYLDEGKTIFLCKKCETEIAEDKTGLCNCCLEQVEKDRKLDYYETVEHILITK